MRYAGQLFQPGHYETFSGDKPWRDDVPVRQERLKVIAEMQWLHKQLYPKIRAQKWDLHPHHQKQHLTSSFHHVWIELQTHNISDHEDKVGRWKPIIKEISSIWLHYGKSKDQLTAYTRLSELGFGNPDELAYFNAFYVHTRIQVYITEHALRLWLLFTDRNLYDKRMFRRRCAQESFRTLVWERMKGLLGKDFFYEIDGNRLPLDADCSASRFFDFLRTDRDGVYSGIAREYDPQDPRISYLNIVKEMFDGMCLLYPMYDLMAYRQDIPKPQPKVLPVESLFGGNVRISKARK